MVHIDLPHAARAVADLLLQSSLGLDPTLKSSFIFHEVYISLPRTSEPQTVAVVV